MALPVDVGGKSYPAPRGSNPYSPVAPSAPTAGPPSAPTAGPQLTQGAPLPNSGVYGAQQATANQAYESAKTSIRTKRLSSLQKYGFLADVDPITGAMSNVHVDPNNQFGQYQQMLRGQAGSADDLLYQEHGRGFTGGLVDKDLGNLAYNQGVQSANFGKGMQSEMSDYDQALLDAGISHDTSLNQISWQQAQDAINNQLFTPVDYGAPVPPYTAPTKAAAKAPSASKLLASYVVKSKKKGK